MIYSRNRVRELEEQGFTLIELLVVIIIIGILAAIAIPLYLQARVLAINATIKTDVRNTMVSVQNWVLESNANAAATGYNSYNGKPLTVSSGDYWINVYLYGDGSYAVLGYNSSSNLYQGPKPDGTASYWQFDSKTGKYSLATTTPPVNPGASVCGRQPVSSCYA